MTLKEKLASRTTFSQLEEITSRATAGRLLYASGDINPKLSTIRAIVEAGIDVASHYPVTNEDLVKYMDAFSNRQILDKVGDKVGVQTLQRVRRGAVSDPDWSTVVAICDAVDELASTYEN